MRRFNASAVLSFQTSYQRYVVCEKDPYTKVNRFYSFDCFFSQTWFKTYIFYTWTLKMFYSVKPVMKFSRKNSTLYASSHSKKYKRKLCGRRFETALFSRCQRDKCDSLMHVQVREDLSVRHGWMQAQNSSLHRWNVMDDCIRWAFWVTALWERFVGRKRHMDGWEYFSSE